MEKTYEEFLKSKAVRPAASGIAPGALNSSLFDFQKKIVSDALAKGRFGIFADCGLGKTFAIQDIEQYILRHFSK